MNDLSKACIDEAKSSMQTAITFLKKELEKIRAGKANPGMLDGVKIDYYGNPTELSQVANINTPDPRSIIIQPWEKTIIGAITIYAGDKNMPTLNIIGVKNHYDIITELRSRIIYSRELFKIYEVTNRI